MVDVIFIDRMKLKMKDAGVPSKVRDRVAWDLLHPKVVGSFIIMTTRLIEAHENKHLSALYLPFEGYRSPLEQVSLMKRGVSKAAPWQSAHNYGMAVDFVGWSLPRGWFWEPADHPDWKVIAEIATGLGLGRPIAWDKPHVEHPLWSSIKQRVV